MCGRFVWELQSWGRGPLPPTPSSLLPSVCALSLSPVTEGEAIGGWHGGSRACRQDGPSTRTEAAPFLWILRNPYRLRPLPALLWARPPQQSFCRRAGCVWHRVPSITPEEGHCGPHIWWGDWRAQSLTQSRGRQRGVRKRAVTASRICCGRYPLARQHQQSLSRV